MPNLPSEKEFNEMFIRNDERKKTVCRCCGNEWKPESYNFYGLCDICFPKWCEVRVKLPPGDDYYTTPESGYYCSCDEWIKDGCPDKPAEKFKIHFKEKG